MFWKKVLVWLGIVGVVIVGAVTLQPNPLPNLRPEELEVLQKVYNLDLRTKADADTRARGLYWAKIHPDRAVIDKLVADGYLEWKPREGRSFDAVWFTGKAITEQKARIEIERDAAIATERSPRRTATSTP